MTESKTKRQHTLPDRRLARAFNFTASDLAANRAGFMSSAQEWGLGLRLRRWLGWLDDVLPLHWFTASRRQTLHHICGRAHISYKQREIYAPFHVDLIEVHTVEFEGSDMRFVLSPQQHQAIAERVSYHVYFDLETKQILSLERAIHGCDEANL